MSDLSWWIYVGLAMCVAHLIASYVASALLLLASLFEHVFQARQARTHDEESLAASNFSIPVSIFAPMHNEEGLAIAVVNSLLAMNYAEYEIIVVNDGSSDRTLDVLREAFDLKPRVQVQRAHVATQPVREVYRSDRHANLIVIDKVGGGKADALNCALNFARYRYICTIDGDTFYFPDALRNSMRPALQNPGRVVGVSSAIGIHRHPESCDIAANRVPPLDADVLTHFQQLEFLRSFLTSRLGATRGGFMLCASGAFALWRRDVVVEIGGFSTRFTCEDIEFTFRVHEAYRRRRVPYRIISLGRTAGVTETPPTLRALISQRARWQRVIMETVWAYRHMLFNPRYGSVGTVGVPLYLVTEVLAPLFQLLAIALFVAAWWLQLLDVRSVQLLLILAFSNGILTNMAVLLEDLQSHVHRTIDVMWLIVLGPLELFCYRPIIIVAQTKGLIDFLRGEKGWHEFERHEAQVSK